MVFRGFLTVPMTCARQSTCPRKARFIQRAAQIQRLPIAFATLPLPRRHPGGCYLGITIPLGLARTTFYSCSMTDTLPSCPECSSTFTYQVDALFICPECGHEWSPDATSTQEVRDAVGNLLADGDTVTVIRDLKVKGSSQVVKVGTKVRGIRLVDGDHDIDCKVPGIGQMGLKSQFVKKVAE